MHFERLASQDLDPDVDPLAFQIVGEDDMSIESPCKACSVLHDGIEWHHVLASEVDLPTNTEREWAGTITHTYTIPFVTSKRYTHGCGVLHQHSTYLKSTDIQYVVQAMADTNQVYSAAMHSFLGTVRLEYKLPIPNSVALTNAADNNFTLHEIMQWKEKMDAGGMCACLNLVQHLAPTSRQRYMDLFTGHLRTTDTSLLTTIH